MDSFVFSIQGKTKWHIVGKSFRLQIILIMRYLEKPGLEVSSVCMQIN